MPARRPKVIVTRRLPEPVETRMRELFEVELNEDDQPFTRDQLAAAMARADVLVPTLTDRIDQALLAQAGPQLRLIANYGAGFDHIDVQAALARSILVTATPGVLTEDTADMTMALILAVPRRLAEGAALLKDPHKHWSGWSPTWMLGHRISGKRLGIVGMGRIGQAVARRARGFDMEIHYHNRTRLAPDLEQGAVFHARFDDMLPHCDFLSINCASTPETRGLLDAEAIARLPDGAVVVNSARGDIVDDEALIAALRSGKLAAAGLDVFRGEPNIDPRYRELDNAFLLPHLGSATLETRIAMGMRAVDNLQAHFSGRPPRDALQG
jgi:glyoxylate reductase